MSTKKIKRFGVDSPFVRLQSEVQQTPQLRQRLIAKLEGLFEARVITLFASFLQPGGFVVDADAEMLESILSVEGSTGKLVLIVNSPGGQALAAERIVNVCRAYAGGRFEVVVPHMAKSAATMICFGADEICMSPTAELGPVDPQLPYKDDKGNDSWISASEYVRSYEDLLGKASSGAVPRIEAFLQQLQRYDSRLVQQLRSAQELSDDIAVRLLQGSMMAGKSEKEIRDAIRIFLLQESKKSHGRMITLDEAQKCGLRIKKIDLNSEVWNALWELYVRSNWLVSSRASKLIESKSSSVSA